MPLPPRRKDKGTNHSKPSPFNQNKEIIPLPRVAKIKGSTVFSIECATGASKEEELNRMRKRVRRSWLKKRSRFNIFLNFFSVFTCPFALDGDAATASPGFSAEASPFAAVLENWAPMLSYSTKKLNRSKRRGNKERWVGINTGRPAAAATHTHTRGEKKREERTEPIIMHSF